MDIYNDGCIDEYGNKFDVAALIGSTIEFIPYEGMIELFNNGEVAVATYEQFDDLFYILNDGCDAALKEDCVFYRVVAVDEVLIRNRRGEERLISMERFSSIYAF